MTAAFVAGGPVKTSAGGYFTKIQDAFLSMTASGWISVVDDAVNVSGYTRDEVVDLTQTALPLVVDFMPGATTITHTDWSGVSTMRSLNIGGNGANGTTLNIQSQTINIQ